MLTAVFVAGVGSRVKSRRQVGLLGESGELAIILSLLSGKEVLALKLEG
jgi:hypothetical protein